MSESRIATAKANPGKIDDFTCNDCPVRDRMLFAGIDLRGTEDLLRPVRHLWYEPGETIYHQGGEACALYSVRRGVVKLSSSSPDGDVRIVRLLGPGFTIGLEALVEDAYEHQASALSMVDVCRIPADAVQKLARDQPPLCRRLMQQWHDQLQQADAHLTELTTGVVRERVLRLIHILDDFGRSGDTEFYLPSNQDCAALVAARVESVSRVMASLKRAGYLVRVPSGGWRLDRSRDPAAKE
ncbi:Crp/Fnr family transcriptional regulator [Mangrovimicrobium sediminis]|uniref:Crp/Fnr family transcriptional regulator n=1 Tax=Mangrovimicrobium sediminis TaxID=2562682 RepID=A0A4Z0M5R5_9GAMM|nr:Crp/Fnr family transcriptional regulator [Haliea sp. SAOS-164]TGD74841.1 Crp/Fnr family transcriptional regulator [Haliea sp. SAOS-164]